MKAIIIRICSDNSIGQSRSLFEGITEKDCAMNWLNAVSKVYKTTVPSHIEETTIYAMKFRDGSMLAVYPILDEECVELDKVIEIPEK